ncbi:tetraspanin-8-like [Etheostoma cragini]|uniref:tetraspanin-8-like n=1 Tax=Etheostoma cragini TaxID=417921 RepID=UPI00155F334E|nr:tetraspanin-8-like [Etheostoma cragini]
MKHNKTDYQMTDELLLALNLLIFIVAVTLIFGFLGCCGAFRENRCLLILFFVGLVLMLFMLLAVGALGAITRTEAVQELVMGHIKQLLQLSEQPKEVQEEFQDLERSGFCCGVFDGYLDWENATLVPDSCNCTNTSMNCLVLDEREIFSTTCMTYIVRWLEKVSDTLLGIAFGFSILIILGMIFSLVLLCQIMNG